MCSEIVQQLTPPRGLGQQRLLWNLTSHQLVSYPIVLMGGILDGAPGLTKVLGIASKRALVIVDRMVDLLHGAKIRRAFMVDGVEPTFVEVVGGEENKTLDQVLAVIKTFDKFHLSRRSEPVIAIGGGVLLDVVGLAASLYRRGISYVRVPTTLMAIVDAGVGAKTGVNYSGHKNRLGTYYPPRSVVLDTTFLETLDARQIANGLAEIVKIALIKDRQLFELIDQSRHTLIAQRFQRGESVNEILDRAIVGMMEELEPNLWETTLERVVDFGHTFSTALEMAAMPSLLHGEAVAVDMALSLVLALRRNLIGDADVLRALQLMDAFGLPLTHPLFDPDLLWRSLEDATIHRNGLQRVPLTNGIGRAIFANDITRAELDSATNTLRELVGALWVGQGI